MTELVKPNESGLAALAESVRAKAKMSKSPNTCRAYERQWRDFVAWCVGHGAQTMPAEPSTVATYVARLVDQGKAVATAEQALAAISRAHKLQRQPTPTKSLEVAEVMSGIRRIDKRKPRKAHALTVEDIRAVVHALSVRNRAILLLGFAACLRRAEIADLKLEDLAFGEQGVDVTIRQSKTDQHGEGHVVGIPHGINEATCPVRALRIWLEERGSTGDALFNCSPDAVYRLTKRIAKLLGREPREFSAHSLRRGGITAMDKARVSLASMQKRSRHKSVQVLLGYVEDHDRFESMSKVGL